jgi:GTP-binding protein
VQVGDTDFVMADIAGLIEGAADGAGMGFYFLRHIERSRVLIHVVDVSGSEGRDPIDDFDKINNELAKYSPKVAAKPQIVAANKIDLCDTDAPVYLKFKDYVEKKGYAVYPISAPIHLGVDALIKAAADLLKKAEELPEEPEETFDFERDDTDPNYRKVYAGVDNGVYVLEGKQLRKIFDSTNFNDMGSLRYLYKYIEKSGALKELRAMGMKEGDTVRIFDFEFEYIDEF